MDANNFTTSEFARMQQQLTTVLRLNKELTAELVKWRPVCKAESSSHDDSITFITQYGGDGLRIQCTSLFLSEAPAEVLNETLHDIARQACLIKEKAVAEYLRKDFIRATDYSKTIMKVKK